MISTLRKNKIRNKGSLLLLVLFLIVPNYYALAQSALSLSVSPTIFDMSANPTQEWTSTVRVINPNPYELKVFANVVNFRPQGEDGQGRFVPIVEEESKGKSMAEWVDVTREEIIIPAEQTKELPFTITVPEDAPPGGHFAAMLIGTKPPEERSSSQMVTSQIVTSLLFLRVTGDVNEDGDIRSFRTADRVIEKPEAIFELRFENKGNVHILPQGEIQIKNMWGQERGIIPINRNTLFGNVLPDSVRQYRFSWTGEWSIADMGRYTAIASLAYGEDVRKFSSSETTFWVLPWKAFLLTIAIFFAFMYIITWGIKLYIRRMLVMSGVVPGQNNNTATPVQPRRRVSVVAPIEAGMLDLSQKWKNTQNASEKIGSILSLIGKYKVFFIVLASIVAFVSIISLYINAASISERPYNVTVDGVSGSESISSEELIYEEKKSETRAVSENETNQTLPTIKIVNRSGVPGLAADLSIRLESEGYNIVSIENDLGTSDSNTVIVYSSEEAESALELSQLMYGALLSRFDSAETQEAEITIYVGTDLENAVQ
jgi:hypothetical protein